MKLQKTDAEGLYRDTETRAVLNRDNAALEAYRKKKKMNEEFYDFKNKINQIDNEIADIKNLLKTIVEKI